MYILTCNVICGFYKWITLAYISSVSSHGRGSFETSMLHLQIRSGIKPIEMFYFITSIASQKFSI